MERFIEVGEKNYVNVRHIVNVVRSLDERRDDVVAIRTDVVVIRTVDGVEHRADGIDAISALQDLSAAASIKLADIYRTG
jgi:hypothetical protein